MKERKYYKNRKIKFREQDYVEKNYIRDGKAVIPIKLDNISDLYMKHDFKNLDLSDEVSDYIEEIAYIIPLDYHIILEIHCSEISEDEQERIRKVIKNNYAMDIDDRDYDVKVSNIRSFLLFILGTVLLILATALENKITLFSKEFLYIAGWVSIWEMFETLLLGNTKKKVERLYKLQLYDSDVIFVFDR